MDEQNIQEQNQAQEAYLQYLTFHLNNEVYGIDISHIREVIDYENVYPVPLVPEYIRGVINLRGEVVPVIDLSSRFGSRPADISRHTSIIIMEVESEEEIVILGAVIDAVNNVVDLRESDIDATPSFGTSIPHDFIAGIGKSDSFFITLLNTSVTFDLEELSGFSTATDITGSRI